MTQHDAVLREIKHYVGEHEYTFLNGACWALFAYLRKQFPQSQPHHDVKVGHIFVQIDDRYYDARGEISYPTHRFVEPLSHRSGISQMRRSAIEQLRRIYHWDAEF